MALRRTVRLATAPVRAALRGSLFVQALQSPLLPSTSAFTVSNVLSHMSAALPVALHAACSLLSRVDPILLPAQTAPTLLHLAAMHAHRLLTPLQSGGVLPPHEPLHHVLRAVRSALQPAAQGSTEPADLSKVIRAACVLHAACCHPAASAVVASLEENADAGDACETARALVATNAGILVAAAANLAQRPEVVAATGADAASANGHGGRNGGQDGGKGTTDEGKAASAWAVAGTEQHGDGARGVAAVASGGHCAVSRLLPFLAQVTQGCCDAAAVPQLRQVALAASADVVGAAGLAIRAAAQSRAVCAAPCIDLACAALLRFAQCGLLGVNDKVDARCIQAMHVGLMALQTADHGEEGGDGGASSAAAVAAALARGVRRMAAWAVGPQVGSGAGRKEAFRLALLLVDASAPGASGSDAFAACAQALRGACGPSIRLIRIHVPEPPTHPPNSMTTTPPHVPCYVTSTHASSACMPCCVRVP